MRFGLMTDPTWHFSKVDRFDMELLDVIDVANHQTVILGKDETVGSSLCMETRQEVDLEIVHQDQERTNAEHYVLFIEIGEHELLLFAIDDGRSIRRGKNM